MSRTTNIARCAFFTLFLSAVGAFALSAAANAQEPGLADKTVEFVIPFSESGGSAQWANFFAPLLSQHLLGKPTVVVPVLDRKSVV